MIPKNELGVIAKFEEWAEEASFELLSIDSRFPDAMVQCNGHKYRVEFEFDASNFIAHKHDVRKCDLIICWENDWDDCVLPVLALSEPTWHETALDLPSDAEREIEYWKQRALYAERRLKLAGRDKQAKQSSPICDLCGEEVASGNMGSHRRWHCEALIINGSAPQLEPAEAAVEGER